MALATASNMFADNEQSGAMVNCVLKLTATEGVMRALGGALVDTHLTRTAFNSDGAEEVLDAEDLDSPGIHAAAFVKHLTSAACQPARELSRLDFQPTARSSFVTDFP